MHKNVGEYMSKVLEDILGDMYITKMQIVPQNPEGKGSEEHLNRTIMNAERPALHTIGMSWK